MANQDLDLAAAARVAVEGARYRGRYRTDSDTETLSPPRSPIRARDEMQLQMCLLILGAQTARVSHQWQVKSREVFVCA